MMKRILIVVVAAFVLAACASTGIGPIKMDTFNAKVLYADAMATTLGQTCLYLSKRDRIAVPLLVRCNAVVKQSGTMIDAARATSNGDQLAAAHEMLLKLEEDLKSKEAK